LEGKAKIVWVFIWYLKTRKLPKYSKSQDSKTLQAKRQIPWDHATCTMPAGMTPVFFCLALEKKNSCTTNHESPRVKSM
jgi:hypothetical protein